MPKVELPEVDKKIRGYSPKKNEKEVQDLVSDRIVILKEDRKKVLPASKKSIESIWQEADDEYPPHELQVGERQRYESDDETGLRSRLVKVGNQDDWQANSATPDFYVKVNTALSILVDQNPEAVFMPSEKRFKASTQLAYSNWKQSWEVSGAKQQMKNMIFNMAKYGTGYMRTYPRLIEQEKSVLSEYYPDAPDKNVYKKKNLVKYNDLFRESLNPWQVWLGKSTKNGDYFTLEEAYHEKTYGWDAFQKEFKMYKNVDTVNKGSAIREEGDNEDYFLGKDDITVGFYQNSTLDLYCIFIPSTKTVLYYSPLPNDDGMIDITFAPWTLRDDRIHFGIGIFEIIRNDVVSYDRLKNMTTDQLTLSIYKMFFYKGTDILGDNEAIVLSPGLGKQVSDPAAVKFVDVPGPGNEAWRGLQFFQDKIDNMSGVTPQLSARFSGKTLGQDMQAKEAALERMKTPLDYILDALQQEAYLTLSWQDQILSTPEVLEYTDLDNLSEALKEFGLADEDIQKYLGESQSLETGEKGDSELLFGSEPDEMGQQRKFANVFKEQSLQLEKDDSGELIESDNEQFFRFGIDVSPSLLKWRGKIRIKPQSVLAPSKELTKRMKLDLFNLVYPAIQGMLAQPQFVPILMPPIKQIIKVYEENVKEWISEDELAKLAQAAAQPVEQKEEPPKISISMKFELLPPDIQQGILKKYVGVEEQLFTDQEAPAESSSPEEELFVDSEQPDFSPLVPRQSIGASASDSGMVGNMNIE